MSPHDDISGGILHVGIYKSYILIYHASKAERHPIRSSSYTGERDNHPYPDHGQVLPHIPSKEMEQRRRKHLLDGSYITACNDTMVALEGF